MDDNECKGCEYYDADGDFCKAFECNGIDCPPLLCEVES